MLLSRAGSLTAAARAQALRSPGSFVAQVAATGRRDWTLSSRRGHALCVDSALAHQVKRAPPRAPRPIQGRDSSPAFVVARWGHVKPGAASLPWRARADRGGRLLVGVSRRHIGGGQPAGSVLFGGASSCSVRSMQTGASSAAAAAKKSEERGATGSDKGDELNMKEASAAEKEPEPEGGKPNKTQQLKKVFKEYGAVGVSFHIGISLMSLGMFYLLLSSGIDMTALLCRLGFSEAFVQSKMAAGTSTFVLAYAVHKLFAPARISITLVSVPLIVRYLRKTGLFKPPTPAP